MYVSDPRPGIDSKHIHKVGCTCERPGKSSHNSISPSCSDPDWNVLGNINMQNTVEIGTIYMMVFLQRNVLVFVANRVSIPQDLFTIFWLKF